MLRAADGNMPSLPKTRKTVCLDRKGFNSLTPKPL
jgi:hypothetical protein